jgi:hypothetical protein
MDSFAFQLLIIIVDSLRILSLRNDDFIDSNLDAMCGRAEFEDVVTFSLMYNDLYTVSSTCTNCLHRC